VKLSLDRITEVPDPSVAPTSALVALLCFLRVEISQNGRVSRVRNRHRFSTGFQMASMPRQVVTAAHCIEHFRRKDGITERQEMSAIYALSYLQLNKVDKSKWFDTKVLQGLGAQTVRSWKSEFPSSGEQLRHLLEKGTYGYKELDAALLQLSGPLRGVVGLNPVPWTTMFRSGALFIANGFPKYYEKEVGMSYANKPPVPMYAAYQDMERPVTLHAETKTFQLPSVSYYGFSGGPLCARRKDILPPTLREIVARLFSAVLPPVQPPAEPRCSASTRKRGETRTAVDPVTGEDLDYPTGKLPPLQPVVYTTQGWLAGQKECSSFSRQSCQICHAQNLGLCSFTFGDQRPGSPAWALFHSLNSSVLSVGAFL
jgi:hypothetical protein